MGVGQRAGPPFDGHPQGRLRVHDARASVPHVFAWGVQCGARQDGHRRRSRAAAWTGEMRAAIVDRFKPTVLACTPSYALHLGRMMAGDGPRSARQLDQDDLRRRRARDGHRADAQAPRGAVGRARSSSSTAAPRPRRTAGGYSCPARRPRPAAGGHPPDGGRADLGAGRCRRASSRCPSGGRGLTVCTNLNSESSPQLRFLVGDYTVLDTAPCAVRPHPRARASAPSPAAPTTSITLRGIKLYPVADRGGRARRGRHRRRVRDRARHQRATGST